MATHTFRKTFTGTINLSTGFLLTQTYSGLGTSLENVALSSFQSIPLVFLEAQENVRLRAKNVGLTSFDVYVDSVGDPPPYTNVQVMVVGGGVVSFDESEGLQANELIARMSTDPRLDAFLAENREKLFKEFLWRLIHEAEMDTLKDLKCRIKEQDITLVQNTRAINLPNDYLLLDSARYKTSSDDVLLEGLNVEIVDQSELP